MNNVADNLPLATIAAAQWEIDVVAKPGGQRDVPATPKLGYASGEVGEIEIPHQIDTEKTRTANGNV